MLPYRPNVCMLVYDPYFRLFLGERRGQGVWQFPQGGVGRKRSPEEAVIKELQEELGVGRSVLGMPRRLEATHRYDFAVPPPHWKDKWRGQTQSFWAVPFLGEDSLIDVSRHEHPEFDRWCWCPAEEVLARVDPIRRAGYERPILEFMTFVRPAMPPDPELPVA